MRQQEEFMPKNMILQSEQIKFPKMVEDAVVAIQVPEVQDMIKRLSDYGLGVFFPHMHTEEGFAPLPKDLVQLEDSLVVSFVSRDDERLRNAFPVGWGWDKDHECVIATCTCGGAAHAHFHK